MTGELDSGVAIEAATTAPADWPELLAACQAADYSHTRHWQDTVCAHRPGARQLWLSARQDGKLVAGLAAVAAAPVRRLGGLLAVRRLESSVEGTSGGPLLHPELGPARQDELFNSLVDRLLAARPGGLASAAIALNPLSEKMYGHLLADRPEWRRQDSPTAMVSLAGGIGVVERERLVMNKRNERNRGLRRGAEVFVTTDADLLAEYYGIYAAACANWGVVPTPLGLLQGLLRDPADRVFFTCVRLDGAVIGGHLCLHQGERVLAWNGVTDPALARTHFPATLCFWGDLVEACRRGAQWLDFGASGGVNSLAGFKRYFGAELMTRGFYVADTSPLRLLRRGGQLVQSLGQRTQRRWHDGATGKPRQGGPA